MIALAFGFGWLGYSFGLYGYCLIKGYNVGLLQLMDPKTIYVWGQGGMIPPESVFPVKESKQAPVQAT